MIKTHSFIHRKQAAILPITLRFACVIAAISMIATLSACQKTPSVSYDSSSVPTETTAATETTEAPVTTTTAVRAIVTGYGWCNATTMHVRSGAGTDFGSIGGLKYGDKVEILGQEGDWYKISHKGGEGYVNAQFIQAEEITGVPTTAAAVTTAATTAVQ